MAMKAFNNRKALDLNWAQIESQHRQLIDILKPWDLKFSQFRVQNAVELENFPQNKHPSHFV